MFTAARSPHIKKPGSRRRLLWMLAGALLAAGVALAICVVYLARHPSAVKPLIEKALSMQTGTVVRIDRLELGFDPLRLDAQGIAVSPGASVAGFDFNARAFAVRAKLTGPFGGRTLSIDSLRLENYTGRIGSAFQLPSPPSGDTPSWWGRWRTRLARFFLFSDLTIQQVEVLNGQLTIETPARQANLSIASIRSDPDGGIRIHADVRVALAGGRQVLAIPELQVKIAPPGLASSRSVRGRIELREGRIDGGRVAATALSGTADIGYDPQLRAVQLASLLLRGRMTARFDSADVEPATFDASLSADASYQLSNAQLVISRWSLDCESLLGFSGSARLQARSPYPFELRLDKSRIESAGLLTQLSRSNQKPNRPVSLSGPVDIRGGIQGRLIESPDRWNASLQASLEKMPLTVGWDGYGMSGHVGGTLQLTGSLLDPLVQARLSVTDSTVTGSPVELDPFECSIDVSGRYPTFRTNLKIRSPRLQLKTGDGKYHLRQVVVSADNGNIDLQSGETAFPTVAISSDTLRNVTLQIDRSKQGLQVELSGSDTGVATAAGSWGLIPADWRLEGSDRIDATMIVDEQQQVLVTSRVLLSAVNAASADEQTIIDALQASADINLRWRPDKRQWASVAQLSVTGGEALVGRYYHDFSANPLTLSGRSSRVLPSRRIEMDGVRLQLAGLLDLQAYGSVSAANSTPAVSATVLLPKTDLLPLFRHFIVEPYKFENPSLEKLSLGGRISAELQVTYPAGSWSALGRLTWSEGQFSAGDTSASAAGIELDFPVWHQAEAEAGPPMPGSLRIAALRLPLMPRQPLQLAFKAGPDYLATTAPVDIALGNGRLQWGAARVDSIYSGRPELTTSLTVDAVSLDALLEKTGGICGGARISGRLDRVTLAGNTLTGRGLLTAEMCGGRVKIRNPGIDRLVSPSPALRFDGVIEAIDLQQLTAGTSFGRIQGVLNGWVRDLKIVNGQPQSFDLLLETERTDGVPQKINVRAVENIARLGGGSSPFMGLAGTVVTLFKEFSYSKIGVRAGLRNDTFRINGTIREGGKEYLVKKGGLSGVDVVNLNPDNQISFRDMVKRIQRIKQSKSGPVVE